MKWYFMASDEADRARWVTGLDCIRANAKEETKKQVSGSADIGSLLLNTTAE